MGSNGLNLHFRMYFFGSDLLTKINGIFKGYALHLMLVRESLRVPFIIVSTMYISEL